MLFHIQFEMFEFPFLNFNVLVDEINLNHYFRIFAKFLFPLR
jgi:hypothetical protein